MTDLVEYLAEKLHQADHGCTCDWVDDCDLRRYAGHETPHRLMQGRRDPNCPQHRRPE